MLIKNLSITDLKNHCLLEHFSFTLGSNDKVGVIGEEGNGKSTLLKAIYCPELIEDYTGISGSIDTQNQTFGYFSQQMEAKWDSVFIWEYLLKEDIHDEIEDYNALAAYEKECIAYHIDPQLITRDQQVGTLSGGEKVKLRLLKVLHHPCDVLLLDEPTNDLDIHTLEWLEKLLIELNKPVLFISHDETLLNNVANCIVHLEQRNKKTKCVHTIFRGSYDEYVRTRTGKIIKDTQLARKEKQEYAKKKQQLNDIQNAVHDALNDTVRNPGAAAKLAKKMRNIKASDARLEKEGYSHVDTMEDAIDICFPKLDGVERKIILKIEDINIQIENKQFLSNVNLLVKGRDKLVVTGDNGCGKTLLMKYIYDNLRERTDIRLGYMPQNYTDAFTNYTNAVDFLRMDSKKEEVSICRELLGRMKFTSEDMLRKINQLSEGQKAKLYLLKFIHHQCNVLLLDEPTRNLSPLTNPIIRHILKQYDGCIISISHDRMYIQEVCDTHYEVVQGKLIQR